METRKQIDISGKADQSSLDSHTSNSSNPHSVSAAQVSALPLSGGTMTGDITMGGNDITGLSGCVYTGGSMKLLSGSGSGTLKFSDNGFSHDITFLGASSTGTVNFNFLNLSASRTYAFPDVAGTIALTSNIPKMPPIVFRAAMADQPDTSPATWNTLEASTNKIYWLMLDYDDTADEYTHFAGYMPSQYNGGTINVKIYWMAANTTASKSVEWEVAFWVPASGDALSTSSYASAQSGTTTDSTTAYGLNTTTISFSAAQADAIAAGNMFVLQVMRDADGPGGSNMAGDAKLLLVTVEEA